MSYLKIILVGLSFLISCLSCEQNPLSGIHPGLLDGAAETGWEKNIKNFGGSLKLKPLLRLTINNTENYSLVFKEGKKQTYTFKFRWLHVEDKDYKIKIGKNSFDLLTGSKWTFDSEKMEGTLAWSPEYGFIRNAGQKQFKFSLKIEVIDTTKTSKVLDRQIQVVVYNKISTPEIYKIDTGFFSYEKLNNGEFFYKNNQAELELNYYKEFSVRNVSLFGNVSLLGQIISIKDQNEKAIESSVAEYLDRPLYYLKKQEELSKDCKTNVEASCLDELSPGQKIDFDTDVYVESYKIPKESAPKDLYSKISNTDLCRSESGSVKYELDDADKEKDPCFISIGRSSRKIKRILKNIKIYTQDKQNSNKFSVLNKSDWETYFHKIPNDIKWQMGGHFSLKESIELFLVPKGEVHDGSRRGDIFYNNEIDIYVKSFTYRVSPILVVDPKENSSVIQSPLTLVRTKKIKEAWILTYRVDLQEYDKLMISLRPYSKPVFGSPVQFEFIKLPDIEKTYSIEFYDKGKDKDKYKFSLLYTTDTDDTDDTDDSVAELKASVKITTQYASPKKFHDISFLKKYFAGSSTSELDKEVDLLELYKIKSEYSDGIFIENSNRDLCPKPKKDGESATKTDEPKLYTITCECDDKFTLVEEQDFSSISRSCKYDISVNLLSKKTDGGVREIESTQLKDNTAPVTKTSYVSLVNNDTSEISKKDINYTYKSETQAGMISLSGKGFFPEEEEKRAKTNTLNIIEEEYAFNETFGFSLLFDLPLEVECKYYGAYKICEIDYPSIKSLKEEWDKRKNKTQKEQGVGGLLVEFKYEKNKRFLYPQNNKTFTPFSPPQNKRAYNKRPLQIHLVCSNKTVDTDDEGSVRTTVKKEDCACYHHSDNKVSNITCIIPDGRDFETYLKTDNPYIFLIDQATIKQDTSLESFKTSKVRKIEY